MSLLMPNNIEEIVVSQLGGGPIKTLDLIFRVREIRPKTTKQAVYAVLRKLQLEEVVVVAKGTASINIAWLLRLSSFLDRTKHAYRKESEYAFLDLEDGERISYHFRTLNKADVFWTQAYHLLLGRLAEGEPVYLYNPHEWFLLAREENERRVFAETIDAGHRLFLTVGGKTPLDKYSRRFFDGEKSQYNMLSEPLFQDVSYYLNIFGDFLVEVHLDRDVVEHIEELYRINDRMSEDVEKKFREIITRSGKTRLTISRSRKKAVKIKRRLGKDFAI